MACHKPEPQISPGLACPGVINDPAQGKWMTTLLNPVTHNFNMLRTGIGDRLRFEIRRNKDSK